MLPFFFGIVTSVEFKEVASVAWEFAQLNNEALQRIQNLERDLGLILIAYRESTEHEVYDPHKPDILTSAWKERVNWEASKRDHP